MATPTFEQLRSRNERALARNHYAPDTDLEGLRAGNFARIMELLEDRAVLERLASSLPQQEAYRTGPVLAPLEGAEQWHADYQLLRIHPASEHADVRRAIFDRQPQSPFRRIQELFSRPEQFAIPQLQRSRPQMRSMSVQGALLSPDRIPDELAESLGLTTFDEHDRPLDRLRKKQNGIPLLKKIWDAARPLQAQHQRMLLIEEPSHAVEARYPGTPEIDPALHGTILYSRENGKGDRTGPRRLVVQHFTDAYAALRKTDHERETYNEERRTVTSLRDRVLAMNRRLNDGWKKGTPEAEKEEMRSAAQALFAEGAERLAACVHVLKTDARDTLLAVQNLRDRNDRENVPASMARMVRIMNRLGARLEDMRPKSGFNEQDRTVLEEQIGSAEQGWKSIRDHIVTAGQALETLDIQERGPAVAAVKRDAHELARMRMRPFRTYAEHAVGQISDMESALRSDNTERAKDALLATHVIGKFQAAHTCMGRLLEETIDLQRIPVRKIQIFIGQLEQQCGAREIFPDRELPGITDAFEALRERITHIADFARSMQGDERDGETLRGMLRQFMETCNPEEIVRALGKQSEEQTVTPAS